jgi:hypothetical protein
MRIRRGHQKARLVFAGGGRALHCPNGLSRIRHDEVEPRIACGPPSSQTFSRTYSPTHPCAPPKKTSDPIRQRSGRARASITGAEEKVGLACARESDSPPFSILRNCGYGYAFAEG